ncbi:metallophosphoesterase [Paenibacillus sp. Soil522]|uniref:metallophosphoesterase n=1 Tax=Paenibacillus sp. Soil522 TaxID=1736388 RepID=UPI0006F392C8|nr:metallophosphoesterase [Paenibacillus sp. Soil522]KRE31605.1 hypothetical protein ASG81_24935 [Paenibacillus sp. Soil522]
MVIIVLLAVLTCVFVAIQTLWVKCSHYQISNKSKVSFTVVQLSDLHGRINFINGSLSSIVNNAKPDYLMITGDLVSKKNQLNDVLKEIQKINCPYIYFVPGNYEREGLDRFRKKMYSEQTYNLIIRSLQDLNISVLSNNGSKINLDDKKCLIYGFDNSIYGNESLTLSIEEIQSYDYVNMLAHSPSIISLVKDKQIPFDLLLVGHTHGGQIRLLNRTVGHYKNYHVGLRQLDKRRHFFINRGLGTVKIPIRVACFPEIAVFKIGA